LSRFSDRLGGLKQRRKRRKAMPFIPGIGNRRFFASTPGKIVALLRRSSHTVEELAHALGLTDNAVRAHLTTLERDGLVQQQGTRPGKRKPSVVYNLAPAAEDLFPKAYGPVLSQLLEVLNKRLEASEVEDLLRTAGRRLAATRPIPSGDLQTRLEEAVSTLTTLGGLAELEQCNGTSVIRGVSCPLAAVVRGHPEVCRLAEALLSELIGVPVQEHCERGEHISCHFVVPGT
jgi:predicted ArsR family transcriptional regulator